MKCHIPQISWHNRDPVLSVDFQTTKNGYRRIATSGTDTHVLIWLLSSTDDGSNINLECVAELSRHSKTVNVVRFSPNGEILASADDEAAVILWKHQLPADNDIFADEETNTNKENWQPMKILRGHIDDICDLSWSADSQFLVTGSVDNTAIMWDITKGKNVGLLSDHKGFVQGVAWDPLSQYIATLSSDRSLRIFNISTKKVMYRVQKAILPSSNQNISKDAPQKATRIFYDDTLKSFCRRLSFSPCGQLLFVPTGIIEGVEGKFTNATYVFTRNNLNKPVLCLPTSDKFTLAVRCCPSLFQLRTTITKKEIPAENVSSEPAQLFSLPYRVVFAVATQDAILFYDTQQVIPFARVSNIHYTRLCDLSWSPDGKILMASSTDGYCSFVLFSDNELGLPYITKGAEEDTKENKKAEQNPLLDNKTESVDRTEQNPSLESKTESMDWTLVLEPDTNDESPVPLQEPLEKQCTNISVRKSDGIANSDSKPQDDGHSPMEEGVADSNNKNSPDIAKMPPPSEKNGNTMVKGARRIQLITLSSSLSKE